MLPSSHGRRGACLRRWITPKIQSERTEFSAKCVHLPFHPHSPIRTDRRMLPFRLQETETTARGACLRRWILPKIQPKRTGFSAKCVHLPFHPHSPVGTDRRMLPSSHRRRGACLRRRILPKIQSEGAEFSAECIQLPFHPHSPVGTDRRMLPSGPGRRRSGCIGKQN